MIRKDSQGDPRGPKGTQRGDPRGPKVDPRGPRGDPRGPKGDPRGTQGDPRGSMGDPRGPKGYPRNPKGGPKGTQGDPRETQGGPKGTQGDPRGTQGGTQGEQGPGQKSLHEVTPKREGKKASKVCNSHQKQAPSIKNKPPARSGEPENFVLSALALGRHLTLPRSFASHTHFPVRGRPHRTHPLNLR